MHMKASKILVGIAAGMLSLALVACGGSSDGSDGSSEEPAAAEEQQAPESDYAVTIDGSRMGTDYEGNPCIIVDFTFTNNSDEATSMAVAANIEVYQDGVELDTAICTDIDTSNYMNNVKTGASIPVTMAYSTTSTSDVEVEVYDFTNFTEDVQLASQTFSVQ